MAIFHRTFFRDWEFISFDQKAGDMEWLLLLQNVHSWLRGRSHHVLTIPQPAISMENNS